MPGLHQTLRSTYSGLLLCRRWKAVLEYSKNQRSNQRIKAIRNPRSIKQRNRQKKTPPERSSPGPPQSRKALWGKGAAVRLATPRFKKHIKIAASCKDLPRRGADVHSSRRHVILYATANPDLKIATNIILNNIFSIIFLCDDFYGD